MVQVLLHHHVAAAGKGRVLVADQDRRAGRRPDRVLGAVDEAEQVPDVEDVIPVDREPDRGPSNRC